MTIIIDGRPFVTYCAGIAGFLKGSVTAWAGIRPDDKFVIALPRNLNRTLDIHHFPANVSFVENNCSLLHFLPNLVWLNICLPILARRFKADFFYSAFPCIPYFLPKRIKTIIVVHDIVNIEYADTMEWTNRLSNLLFFNRSIRKANQIWANSHYTCQQIEKYFPVRKCRDIFIGCAVDNDTYKHISLTHSEENQLKRKYGIVGDYLLFVGSIEPRKNLSFLLSLMPRLYKDQKLTLVVVGGKGWKSTSIVDIIEAEDFPKDSVIFCNYVPDCDLVRLYNMASCFVSASINEGFGMPQLESLLCGCPVITSHNSAMLELARGKAGIRTVEGYDPDKWIDTIKKVLAAPLCPVPEELAVYNWREILSGFLSQICKDENSN